MSFKILSSRKVTLLNSIRIVQQDSKNALGLIEEERYRHALFLMREVLHNAINIELAETLANDWWNEDESVLASDCMHLFHDILVMELPKEL